MSKYIGWSQEDRLDTICDIFKDVTRRKSASKASLNQSNPLLDRSAALKLLERVDISVKQFRANSSNPVRHRQIHDQLRKIWHAANNEKTSLAEIEKTFLHVSPTTLNELKRRVTLRRKIGLDADHDNSLSRLMERVRGSSNDNQAKDNLNRLKSYLRLVSSNGAQIVDGRTRPGGKRSRQRIEPVVLGFSRGSVSSDSPAPPVGGRPENEAHFELIMNLALDWLYVTGRQPEKGRSDQTPFGQFVYAVFEWVQLKDPDYSLRAFWERYNIAKQPVGPESLAEQE